MKLINLSIVAGFLAFGATALGADLVIAGFESTPFTIVDGKNLSGVGVDVATQLIKKTGNNVSETKSDAQKRIMGMTNDANVVFSTVKRSPDRESKMQWIGKIADDTNCFFTMKEKAIKSLDEAKKLSSVGVNGGGTTEKFLIDNGFKNIESVGNNALNFKKVEGGRIPAWYTSELVSKYTALKEKGDLSKYTCGGNIEKSTFWIAASMKMDAAIVTQLKAKFTEMEKSGEIEKISQTYLK